jgi:hypothetical protein
MVDGDNREKKKLMEAFLKLLNEERGSGCGSLAEAGSQMRQEQMRDLLTAKVDELSDKRWKVHIGDWEVAVSDLFAAVLSSIITAKDAIAAVAGSDPNVTLACAGASVILSVSASTDSHDATQRV